MLPSFKASVVISWPQSARWEYGRYVRAASASVNWPKRLEALRSTNFSGADAKAQAVRLLSGCGFKPVVETDKGRKVSRWTEEHINAALLTKLRSLQRAVIALYDERDEAIQQAWNYRLALSRPSVRSEKQSRLDMERIAKGLVSHLKQLRVDVPLRDPKKTVGGEYLSDLVRALRLAIQEGKEKKPLEQVMQSITKTAPIREVKAPEPPYPDAVLRHLLDFSATDGIETSLSFDRDGLPVVRLMPRNPIAGLLLRAHAATVLRPVTWALCKWCGKQYPQTRQDQKACSESHNNNLKKARQRRRKITTKGRSHGKG